MGTHSDDAVANSTASDVDASFVVNFPVAAVRSQSKFLDFPCLKASLEQAKVHLAYW